jgi:hypothetical protein
MEQLDGNAAAGILQAIFPYDMTMARITCSGCGATLALGETAAYLHGMGTVLRCPISDTVLIRVAHIRGRYLLDLRGVQVLQISAEA